VTQVVTVPITQSCRLLFAIRSSAALHDTGAPVLTLRKRITKLLSDRDAPAARVPLVLVRGERAEALHGQIPFTALIMKLLSLKAGANDNNFMINHGGSPGGSGVVRLI
jgi:hypothetical protein